ncbi:MAG: peptidoglycan editing factor PgeF [Alphaproteobacteria bacterium]|nr:peptidoglycan editing factor PgeF [Alphaproteobacteria bacterium]
MIRLDVFDSTSVRHAFFTRQGGVSEGLCASLNCGFTANDDAARVGENRARAMRALDLAPDRLATAKQVHGAEALVVEAPWPQTALPRADALVTRVPGVALGILTADCVPILFADAEARVIGAAHAGWRGALAGVIEAAVAAMEDLGASAQRTVAAIGPAIAQASYEVGPEFPRRFLAQDPGNSVFFMPSLKTGHFLFDLKGYVARRLEALGIRAIAHADADTAADPERFFSYRRACLRGELGHGLGLSTIALAP